MAHRSSWFSRSSSSALALMAAVSVSCVSSGDKSAQLARVAKDWCLTIRASQVLPVYPLTQDLWPGDVFLTTTPIGEETDRFEERGFLPLDFHLVRLATREAMAKFYSEQMIQGDGLALQKVPLSKLPGTAFPTYSFSISRAGGMNLALPVQGVPFGFGVLGTAAATGTVTIGDARTFGLDVVSLQPLLAEWEKNHRALLASYGTRVGSDEQAVYLRVIARVYQAKSVVVSLADASASGAEAAGGLDVGKPDAGTPDAQKPIAELYADLAKKLDANGLERFGGKVRFLSASRRAISLEETFDEPMTVGYLAYDCRVLPGGVLSMPMPTWQRLDRSPVASDEVWNSAALIESWYTADDSRIARIRAWMEQNLAKETRPTTVAFLAEERWEVDRRRMVRDLGILPL